MASIIPVYLFILAMVTLVVNLFCTSLKTHWRTLPWWFPLFLVVLMMAMLILVPIEGTIAPNPFRNR